MITKKQLISQVLHLLSMLSPVNLTEVDFLDMKFTSLREYRDSLAEEILLLGCKNPFSF